MSLYLLMTFFVLWNWRRCRNGTFGWHLVVAIWDRTTSKIVLLFILSEYELSRTFWTAHPNELRGLWRSVAAISGRIGTAIVTTTRLRCIIAWRTAGNYRRTFLREDKVPRTFGGVRFRGYLGAVSTWTVHRHFFDCVLLFSSVDKKIDVFKSKYDCFDKKNNNSVHNGNFLS